MTALLHSRKFLILSLDTIISLVLFGVGQFFPSALEATQFVIGALQPVAVMMIAGIAWEDAAEKSAQIVEHVRVKPEPEPEQPVVQ